MAHITRLFLQSSRICSENFTFIAKNYTLNYPSSCRLLTNLRSAQVFHTRNQRNFSSDGEPKQNIGTSQAETTTKVQLSQKARFKVAIRDYGATIIIFHIAISLTSLGICYVAVSNGVDALALISRLGLPDSVTSSAFAAEGSTFVMAYAVHKLFVPARMAITLSAAPFIVKYLRKINLLKPPK